MDFNKGKFEEKPNSPSEPLNVDVEYCGYCNFKSQCLELSKVIKDIVPEADVTCRRGRQGAFEVKINGTLIHSKIQSFAFPEYKDVAENVKNAREGKPLKEVSHQPITDCVIM